jgi:hypothetical protein
MGCGKPESVDESLAVTVVQCDSWFGKRDSRISVQRWVARFGSMQVGKG